MDGMSLNPFTIYEWINDKERNAYVFIGNNDSEQTSRDIKRKYENMASVKKIHIINDAIHNTDTIETIRYKIAHHYCDTKNDCKQNKLANMYMWIKSYFSTEDKQLFVQNVFKHDIKLKKKYLNHVCKAYMNKKVYDSESDDEFEVPQDFLSMLQNKKINHIYRNVSFKFNTVNDYEVTLSPQPFVDLNEVIKTNNKTRFDKSILLKFKLIEKELHFVSEGTNGIAPVYFSNTLKYDADIHKIVRLKSKIQSEFVDLTNVINDIGSKIDNLFFRVLPLSHNLDLNLKTLFKISETTYNVPIIVYKSNFTNEYKINRMALADMSKKQLDLFHEKETKQKESSINRANEVIIFYIKIAPNNFFYFLLSSNGSYRLKYKSSKSNLLNIDDIRQSFALLTNIYDLVDNSFVYRIDESTDIFNSSLVEVIDYNTQNLVSVKTPMVKQAVFQDKMASNNPFFGEFKKEAKNVYITEYIETNNFYNADTISAFIYKNIELNRREIINKMKSRFNISEEEAIEVYDEKRNNIQLKISKKGKNIFAVRPYHTAVYVRINLLSDYSIKIYTSNTQDIAYQTNIVYLLTQYLTQNIAKQKGVDNVFQNVMDNNPSAQMGDDDIQFNDLMANINDTVDDEFDFSNIDLDLGSPHVNVESDMDDFDIDLNDVENDGPDEPDVQNEPFQFDDEEPANTAPQDPSQKQVKANDYTTFVLLELYKADRNLFLWPDVDTNLKNYSSKCGATNFRQPIVIDKKQKTFIDKTQPGSYTGFVQTGSTDKLKKENYYICPKIWCPISRVSLTAEAYARYGNKCPPPHGENPLFFPKRGVGTNYFKKSDGSEPHWPALMNKNVHPKGMELPCCGKKEYKTKENTTNQDNNDDDDRDKKKRKSNYISTNDILLNADQFGNLPHTLNKILNNKATCGGILDSKTTCYVRTGTENSPNSLMDALSKGLGVDSANDHILKNLKLEEFIFLNAGNTLKTYMDNNNIFTLADEKEYELFKEHLKNSTDYVNQFKLHTELDYVLTHNTLQFTNSDADNDLTKMSILREYLIFRSFMNFRKYIASTDIPKHPDDIHHVLTFYSINKKRTNFIFLESVNDDLYFLNPIYFNYKKYYSNNSSNSIILKTNDHYEYISHINQLSNLGPLIPAEKVQSIIQSISLPDEDTEEKSLYKNKDIGAYVLSTSLKCMGYVTENDKTIHYTTRPFPLQYDKLQTRSFVYIDKLKAYVEQKGLSGYQSNEDIEQDLSLFVNSITSSVEENRVNQEYEVFLHEVAKKMLYTKKLNDSLHIINHALSNFTATERNFLLERILKESKIKIPEGINKHRLVNDLLHIPLSVIVDNFQLNNKPVRDDEIVVNLNDIHNRVLYEYKDQINKNPFKILSSSSEDMVHFIDYLKIDHNKSDEVSTDKNSPGIQIPAFELSINRTEIKPSKFKKMFKTFEVVDDELSFEKVINMFHFINDTFTLNSFKEKYSERIFKMRNDKDALVAIFKLNANSAVHKIGKKTTINDFIGLVDRVNYKYSLFELQVMAKLANLNLIIVGRHTNMIPNGFLYEDNKSKQFVILMYTINKTHHSYFVVTLKTPEHAVVRYSFTQNDFSPELNEFLTSYPKKE